MSDFTKTSGDSILLERMNGQWRAALTNTKPSWQSKLGDISSVVAEARGLSGLGCALKVAPSTALDREDVLALIAQNGGPQDLDLSECTMVNIDLSSATLAPVSRQWETTVGRLPPWWSEVTEGINLRGSILDGAILAGVGLQSADMLSAQLRGSYLLMARLQGALLAECDLTRVNLTGAQLQDASLRDAKLSGVRWYNSVLRRTRMTREQLAYEIDAIGDEIEAWGKNLALPYARASEAYLLLKNNFLTLGRYEDASWAYVKEQRMKKAAFRCELRRARSPTRNFWKNLGRWLLNWTWDAVAGYGETPQKPLGAAVVLATAFFPVLYWATGALPGHSRAFSSSLSDINWSGWRDSFIFSLTTFGTLSFNRLQPEGDFGSILAAFEAFTGVLLFALFVFTLGNRMSRS